jgi:predicted nucleic acid-binding protein
MDLVIDTNILIYDFIENSEYHREVKEKTRNKLLIVPTNILIEFILVCKKLDIDDKEIYKKVEEILENCFIVEIDESLIKEAISICKEHKIDLKEINDIILLSISKKFGCYLYTYDKKLRKIGNKLGVKIY